MYDRIMVPVDLAHLDKLEKALETAADLAKRYDASVCYVGVTTSLPSEAAHNQEEFAEKFDAFAAEESSKRNLEIKTRTVVSHDPVRELDDLLSRTVKEIDADLVVIGSHVPTFADHVFTSNAGYLVSHVATSVFVVR